jgi:NAD(P)-dependent dehydrogenase (short-subunit alcohol dehydrogenase family)
MFDFTGKVAVVTGASGIGIGKYIAKHFFEAGAKVAICSRSQERILAAKEEIGSSDPERIFAYAADMSKVEEVRGFIRAAIDCFGRVDILVNNAGLAFPKPSLEVTEEDWDTTFDTNIKGYFFCAQAAAADMIRRGEPGSIINIGSVNSYIVTIGQAAYAATKAGVSQMTKSLAREWGPNGIRVNCIAPGSIPTLSNAKRYSDPAVHQAMCDSLALRRRGKADEIADAVLYMASEYSSYVTGQTLHVDGGLTMLGG